MAEGKFDSYKRACVRDIEREGIEVSFLKRSCSLADGANENIMQLERVCRLRVWRADSLLTAFRALEWGETVLALRCAFQAYEYTGRIGHQDSTTADATIALRNELEKLIGSVGASAHSGAGGAS